jgi:hypothetical protein
MVLPPHCGRSQKPVDKKALSASGHPGYLAEGSLIVKRIGRLVVTIFIYTAELCLSAALEHMPAKHSIKIFNRSYRKY